VYETLTGKVIALLRTVDAHVIDEGFVDYHREWFTRMSEPS
jgi:hypothetical protein